VKIAVVDTLYDGFLRWLYGQRPQLASGSYREQLDAILAAGFGTSDAYTYHLGRLGHDAVDLCVNGDLLQRTWAKEHGAARWAFARERVARGDDAREAWRRRLMKRVSLWQLDALAPDVVFLHTLTWFTPNELAYLRRRGALLVGQLGSAAPHREILAALDLVVTCMPPWRDRLRAMGVDAEYQPLAFDERMLERATAAGIPARDVPVAFVGSIHPPSVHRGGTEMLEAAVEALDAPVWGLIADDLDPASPLAIRHRGEVWAMDMYRTLLRIQVLLNRHGDVAEGYTANMRLYEGTGMGAVVLTEAAPNLAELFEPGQEIVSYRDADDLVACARALRADGDRRRAIAAAGQARTLRQHTYAQRIPELAVMIEARL